MYCYNKQYFFNEFTLPALSSLGNASWEILSSSSAMTKRKSSSSYFTCLCTYSYCKWTWGHLEGCFTRSEALALIPDLLLLLFIILWFFHFSLSLRLHVLTEQSGDSHTLSELILLELNPKEIVSFLTNRFKPKSLRKAPILIRSSVSVSLWMLSFLTCVEGFCFYFHFIYLFYFIFCSLG